MWNKNVTHHLTQLCSKQLEERLFWLSPIFRQVLRKVREQTFTMQVSLRFIGLETEYATQEATYYLREFRAL